MLTRAGVEKLGSFHSVRPEVLSLYLHTPSSAAEPGQLSRRVAELIAAAEAEAGLTGCLGEQDRCSALEAAVRVSHVWPGRTVAIVACGDIGLDEVFPLPGPQPEQAVLGVRPHIRPLLDALQQSPRYRVAVLDGPRTWIFRVQGDEMTAVPRHEPGYGEDEPLVIGGRDDEVRLLLASLTPADRAAVAGCFTVETGLSACLAAVSAGSADALIVPARELVPGYECGRCGALSLTPESCPDWGTAPLPVPDVVEEMVIRVLEDGGDVSVTHDAAAQVAARLRPSAPTRR